MSQLTTYTIGRQTGCEIALRHATVSRRHAELVRGRSGKLLLTDCNSSSGTFVRTGSGWERIRQREVKRSDQVKFGEYATTVDALLGSARSTPAPAPQTSPQDVPPDNRPIGAVRRDPATGAIIARDA